MSAGLAVPKDEDVVVWLDADDWLADDFVLEHLAAQYAPGTASSSSSSSSSSPPPPPPTLSPHPRPTPECLMTYGSLVYFPYGVASQSPPFPQGGENNKKKCKKLRSLHHFHQVKRVLGLGSGFKVYGLGFRVSMR
jgi:hypothetical protein